MVYNDLEIREAFHLGFIRMLLRKIPPSTVVLKGGSNLRFFFKSSRFSEYMDLDVQNMEVHALQDAVMSVLGSKALAGNLLTYGVERITPPDMARAKQTETVQRFKVHLLTAAGEDLFTKIEFSRRGISDEYQSEGVISETLARYRMPPLVMPHYTAPSALRQKLQALHGRSQPEARDVFDVYILRSRPEALEYKPDRDFTNDERAEMKERIYAISFEEFRDKVLAFLSPGASDMYNLPEVWDELRLSAIEVLG